jgi:hypothetical protein
MDASEKALVQVRNIAMRKAYVPNEVKKYIVDDGKSVTIRVAKNHSSTKNTLSSKS